MISILMPCIFLGTGMANLGTAVDFTDVIAFFRRVDGKIESLLNDFRGEDRRIVSAIGELKRHQEYVEARLERLIKMFMYRMAKEDDNHLEAFANTQEGVIVLKALHQWFTKKEEDTETRIHQFSALKAVGSSKPAGTSRDVKGKGPMKVSHKVSRPKGIGIKLNPIKEDMGSPPSREDDEVKARIVTDGSENTNQELPRSTHTEASAEERASDGDIKNVQGARDKDLNTIQATGLVKDFHDPRRRLMHLFKLTVLSDSEWKPVEDILTRCDELGVEICLWLVELYVQVLLANKQREISRLRAFTSRLKTISEEESNRDVMKWILQALKVTDEELGKEDTTGGRDGTPTTVEEGSSQARQADQDEKTPDTWALVEDLVRQFSSVIVDLDSLMRLTVIPRSIPISHLVKEMDEKLKRTERKVDTIRRNTEELGIKLKYGRYAPLLIGIANNCGLCFERWIYHGKLR